MSADLLAFHLYAEQIKFVREFKFHPTRRWRADFAIAGMDGFNDCSVLVEVDGGNFMAAINRKTGKPVAIGRHTKDADYEKLNEAAILGFMVLRFSTGQVKRGEAIATIKRALA